MARSQRPWLRLSKVTVLVVPTALVAVGCMLSPLNLAGRRCRLPDECGPAYACIAGVCTAPDGGGTLPAALALTGPAPLFLGQPSGPLMLTARLADGGTPPAGSAPVTVTLGVDSDGGQLSLAQDGGWGPQLSAALQPGIAVTFFYRDSSPGAHHLSATAAGWQAGTAPTEVLPIFFADDFESGTLLSSDSPAGQWDGLQNGGGSIQADAAAAHRGAYGLDFFSSDATARNTAGLSVVRGWVPPVAPDVYLRFWIRVNGTSDGGTELFTRVGTAPATTAPVTAGVVYPNNIFLLNGHDSAGNQVRVTTSVSPGTSWHLVELAIQGFGTTAGSRALYIDGMLAGSTSGINWTGTSLSLNQIELGEAYSNMTNFTGNIEFDDFRAAVLPLASSLAVSPASASVDAGTCLPVQVGLVDSISAAPAAAPYDAAVTLSASLAGSQFYADPGCSSAASASNIPMASTGTTVYWLSSSPGTATLSASSIDFLPGSATVIAR